jgi:hypothetical protein
MRPRARRRFESHLLACESCWREVSLARRGRELAESACQVAPPGLRDDIRAAVASAAARQPAGRLPVRRPAAVAAAAAVGPGKRRRAGATVAPPAGPAPAPPAALAAAVASYRADQLPGTSVPAGQVPDLARLNLRLVAGAAGRLDGIAVTMFVYRTAHACMSRIY